MIVVRPFMSRSSASGRVFPRGYQDCWSPYRESVWGHPSRWPRAIVNTLFLAATEFEAALTDLGIEAVSVLSIKSSALAALWPRAQYRDQSRADWRRRYFRE